MSTKVAVGILLAVVIIVGAYLIFARNQGEPSDGTTTTEEGEFPVVGSISGGGDGLSSGDQISGSSSVTARLVAFADGGFVVVHENANGTPGTILGSSAKLGAGVHSNVEVELSRSTRPGEVLHVMLHADTDANGQFNAAVDLPIKDASGSVIVQTVTVLKAEADAEVRSFTVTGDEFSFSPAIITVNRGDTVRLTFRNTGDVSHNWIVEGLNIRTDTIAAGGTDTIEFTASQTGRFTVYCGVPGHRANGMVGTLVVQ
jgi:plastocyanin